MLQYLCIKYNRWVGPLQKLQVVEGHAEGSILGAGHDLDSVAPSQSVGWGQYGQECRACMLYMSAVVRWRW